MERCPQRNTTEEPSLKKREQQQRWTLVVFLSLASCLFTGAFLGWGPMQLLLEENESFSSLCNDDEDDNIGDDDDTCPAQSEALLAVQFYALCTQISAPILGEIMDKFGRTVMACTMATSLWTGLVLFILAVEYEDYLLYPAFIFFGLSTWMGTMLFIPSALLFKDQKTQSRVIILLNSLFDVGSITFLCLWWIGQAGLSLTMIGIAYFAVGVVVYGGVCFFSRICKAAAVTETSMRSMSMIFSSASASMVHKSLRRLETSLHSTSAANMGAEMDISQALDVNNEGNNVEDKPRWESTVHDAEGDQEEQAEQQQQGVVATKDNENTIETSASDYVLVADRTQREQLTSGIFILLAAYWTINVAFNHWVTTTQREFLAFLGDDEQGNKYLFIFTVLQPVSFFFAPLTDVLINRVGYSETFCLINLLTAAFCLIRLLSSNLNVQMMAFAIFSFLRSLFFGTFFSFVPTVLSLDVIGKAVGIVQVLSGLAAFVNVELSKWAIEEGGSDFFYPDLIYTLLVLPSFGVLYGIAQVTTKESRLKKDRCPG